MSCYLNNSLFTTFCNRHCCPPVIVHIFELEYFNFFHFKFSCAINDNFFVIYYSCNNTRFLRATSFSSEFLERNSWKRFSFHMWTSSNVILCMHIIFFCFKMLIFKGRSTYSQPGLVSPGQNRNNRADSGDWL
jgi:hypothetical protein